MKRNFGSVWWQTQRGQAYQTALQQLIEREIHWLYDDPHGVLHDATRLELPHGRLAFSTDGYVVHPLEFPGGDIGKLAIIGTANDLAMAAARPLHLSVALILEEGLPLELLRRVLASMAAAARACGVSISTGDTKVVERGKGDGLFVTTSGIGLVETALPVDPLAIQPGDQVLVSGDLGRHGLAIAAARYQLDLQPPIETDCAPLWPAVARLLAAGVEVHCLRDLTRGGLGSALQELAQDGGVELALEEAAIPVATAVARSCELLGFDPLHLANEGRFVAVVRADHGERALAVLAPAGGACIGTVRACSGRGKESRRQASARQASGGKGPGRVLLRTALGTERLLVPFSGEMLPRIC